jgi:hypothetical protein
MHITLYVHNSTAPPHRRIVALMGPMSAIDGPVAPWVPGAPARVGVPGIMTDRGATDDGVNPPLTDAVTKTGIYTSMYRKLNSKFKLM